MSSTTLTTEMLDFLFKQAFSSHHGDQLLNLVDTRCSDELIHNFYRHKTAPTWVDFQKVKTQNDKPLQISFEVRNYWYFICKLFSWVFWYFLFCVFFVCKLS